MTAELAGRITVTVILIIVSYALLMVAAGRFLGWLGRKYPRVYATQESYYGIEPYDGDEEEQSFLLDEDEQPHPPTRAA